jgi:hypothetical protein
MGLRVLLKILTRALQGEVDFELVWRGVAKDTINGTGQSDRQKFGLALLERRKEGGPELGKAVG